MCCRASQAAPFVAALSPCPLSYAGAPAHTAERSQTVPFQAMGSLDSVGCATVPCSGLGTEAEAGGRRGRETLETPVAAAATGVMWGLAPRQEPTSHNVTPAGHQLDNSDVEVSD